jgi:hypothetical protein
MVKNTHYPRCNLLLEVPGFDRGRDWTETGVLAAISGPVTDLSMEVSIGH